MAGNMRRCDDCGRNRNEKFFKPRGRVCLPCQKKKRAKSAHAYRIARTYGLDQVDYEELWRSQNGCCAICDGTRDYNLAVDHDHVTGYVRGLLCKLCNSHLLTAARDDPAVLRRAAEYLESPPAFGVVGQKKVHFPDE